jgi:hypothetical protein
MGNDPQSRSNPVEGTGLDRIQNQKNVYGYRTKGSEWIEEIWCGSGWNWKLNRT